MQKVQVVASFSNFTSGIAEYDLRRPVSIRKLKMKKDTSAYPMSYEAHQKFFRKEA
jgi:hypothetical protein